MSGSLEPKSADTPRSDRSLPALRDFVQDIWLGMKHRPVRTVSILGALTAVVILLAAGMKHLAPAAATGGIETDVLAAQALAELDAGHFDAARQIAAGLRLHDLPAAERGIPPYVLGMAMRHDAQQGDWQPRERKSLYLLAARYLDESRQAGFPAGREQEGLVQLGKSWRDCGRYAQALAPLRELRERQPAGAAEVDRLLAECCLHDRPPRLAQANDHIRRYLSEPSLSAGDRTDALLTQARILFQLERWDECQGVIDNLAESSGIQGDVLLLAARLLLREGDRLQTLVEPQPQAAAERYAAARRLVEQAATEPVRLEGFRRQQQYLLGMVYLRQGDASAAEDQFARTARAHLDSPEGIAAAFEQAEVQHRLGKDAAALDTYRLCLRRAAESGTHAEPWLTDDQIRQRVEGTTQTYVRRRQFVEAGELAEALFRLFSDARTVLLQASVHRTAAQHLASRAASEPADSATLRAQASAELRRTGKLLEQLARLRFATREYAGDLWDSAESYLAGHDYEGAARMYARFLEHEGGGARPAALVRLGETDMARNDPAAALRWLDECVEFFPRSPHVYRARILAAQARLELGEVDQAKQLLTTNLEHDALTPASREWRESLFLMGKTLFEEGLVHEALSRLKGVDGTIAAEREAGMDELRRALAAFADSARCLSEVIQRDPGAPQVVESSYMLAQSRLQSARLTRKVLPSVLIETARVEMRSDLRRNLLEAAQRFDQLAARLTEKQEREALSTAEQRILRNCCFSEADALFDLQQYDEAIQAYASATNRYQHEPISLEAYVQMANCHRKLNRPKDAQRTLEQARLILNRIRPDADFLATTRYGRQEWNDLLNWLTSL